MTRLTLRSAARAGTVVSIPVHFHPFYCGSCLRFSSPRSRGNTRAKSGGPGARRILGRRRQRYLGSHAGDGSNPAPRGVPGAYPAQWHLSPRRGTRSTSYPLSKPGTTKSGPTTAIFSPPPHTLGSRAAAFGRALIRISAEPALRSPTPESSAMRLQPSLRHRYTAVVHAARPAKREELPRLCIPEASLEPRPVSDVVALSAPWRSAHSLP